MNNSKLVLGVIIGNRDFFPDALVGEAREDVVKLFGELRHRARSCSRPRKPSSAASRRTPTPASAPSCSAGIATRSTACSSACRTSATKRAWPTRSSWPGSTCRCSCRAIPTTSTARRRAAARLRSAARSPSATTSCRPGITFSLTTKHVCHPLDAGVPGATSQQFVAVCRVVQRAARRAARRGRRAARRVQHRPLQREDSRAPRHQRHDGRPVRNPRHRPGKLGDGDAAVQAKLDEITAYAPAPAVPAEKLVQMARLGVVLGDFDGRQRPRRDRDPVLDLRAAELRLQRLHADEHDERERSCPAPARSTSPACSRCTRCSSRRTRPAALVDWNNNYGDDEDKCVLFHCGNWAKTFLPDIKIANAPILGSTLGVENTYGALEGRTPGGPADVRPHHHRRHRRRHPRLRRRRRTDERRAEHLRQPRRRARAAAAEAAAVRLPRGLRAPRRDERIAHGAACSPRRSSNYLGWEVYHHEASRGDDMTDGSRARARNRSSIGASMLRYIMHAGAGHTGGSLSCVDILNVLYNRVLRVSPETFGDPQRDRYIQSKGHSVEALYRRAGRPRVLSGVGARNALPVPVARSSAIRRARCRASR